MTNRSEISRKIADYEKASGIFWIGLGILQIFGIVTAFAGAWNILAGISRLNFQDKIRRRDESVPAAFEGLGQLIVIGIINFFLGAFVGLILVGLDFYIRELVLQNKKIFCRGAQAVAVGIDDADLNRLEQLGRLRSMGALTEAEFAAEKRRLI